MSRPYAIGKGDLLTSLPEQTPYYVLFGISWESYTGVKLTSIFTTPRVLHALQNAGIKNLGQLLCLSRLQLFAVRNLGAKSLDEINQTLKGIFLANQRPDLLRQASLASLTSSRSHAQYEVVKKHSFDIAMGSFQFIKEEELSGEDLAIISEYREVYNTLGPELAYDCYFKPYRITPILTAFEEFTADRAIVEDRKNYVATLQAQIPAGRLIQPAFPYLNAFTSDLYNNKLLLPYYTTNDSLLRFIQKVDLSSNDTYQTLVAFCEWCSFDIPSNVNEIIKVVFTNDRIRGILKLRANNCTLDVTGKHFGITRERVRQIEAKASRILLSLFHRDSILPKISAVLNGDTIIPVLSLDEYFGDYCQEIVYILRANSKYEAYSYDDLLDSFVLGGESISDKIQNALDSLPEYFPASKLETYVMRLSRELTVPLNSVQLVLNEVYSLTGTTYHRTRLTRSAIYTEIVRKYYPSGIWIYDNASLTSFRKHLLEDYGLDTFEQSDHAIATIIMHNCIICDRGTYRAPSDSYLSPELLSRIQDYIDRSPNNIVLVNAIYEQYQDELLQYGVYNRYYLFGILHLLLGNKYLFRKGYIYKDSETSNIYTEILRFVKQSAVPIIKEEIYRKFPGITDIVISIALSDDTILNYFGEYLYAGSLRINQTERQALKSTLDSILRDKEAHHSKDLYEPFARAHQEVLNRNGINFSFRLYSVLEYLFREDYQFSRPYIAKKGITIGKTAERLNEFIMSMDEVSISDISAFARDIHYNIYSMTDFIDSLNGTFFFRDHETIARIDSLGLTPDHAAMIEELILTEISSTELIANLECIHRFPKISVPWNEWIIYSTLKRWSKALEVSTTNPQLRYATPVVAPRGNLNASKYDTTKDYSHVSIVQADNLDNIDDLIADYILDGDI